MGCPRLRILHLFANIISAAQLCPDDDLGEEGAKHAFHGWAAACKNLTELDLSQSRLDSPSDLGFLRCYPALTKLLLYDVGLRALPAGAFDHLHHLEKLGLSRNVIPQVVFICFSNKPIHRSRD